MVEHAYLIDTLVKEKASICIRLLTIGLSHYYDDHR